MGTPWEDGGFCWKILQILGQLQLSLEEKISCIHAMNTKLNEHPNKDFSSSAPSFREVMMFQTQQIGEDSSRFVISEPENNDVSRFKN